MSGALREVVQYKGCEVIGIAIPARGQFLRETRLAGFNPQGVRRELPVMAKDQYFPTAQEAIDAAIKAGRAWLDGRDEPMTFNW